jgi:hypothetical protein
MYIEFINSKCENAVTVNIIKDGLLIDLYFNKFLTQKDFHVMRNIKKFISYKIHDIIHSSI